MEFAVGFVGIANLALFAAIAVVAVGQLRREQGRSSALWAALAFVALAWVVISSAALPEHPASLAAKALLRLDLALFVLFPYFLYRFAASFEASSRPLARFVGTLTTALVLGSFLLPHIPGEGDPWPWWFVIYAVRVPRPLVAAPVPRLRPALARRQPRGDRRPAADEDACARVAGDDRVRRALLRNSGCERARPAAVRPLRHPQRALVPRRPRAAGARARAVAPPRGAARAARNRRADDGHDGGRRRRPRAAVDGAHRRRPRDRPRGDGRPPHRRVRLARPGAGQRALVASSSPSDACSSARRASRRSSASRSASSCTRSAR